MTAPPSHVLDPDAIVKQLDDCGITHVITVPDYVMLSVYRALESHGNARLVYCCTEDEAVTIAAGLHIGGARPMVMMQNQGLYASLNAVRAIGLDARIPLFMMIGQFGREYRNLGRPAATSARPLVRNCERILDALEIPYVACEADADIPEIGRAYRRAQDSEWPAAALIGTYTAWPAPSQADLVAAASQED